jgi:hypothetical protein
MVGLVEERLAAIGGLCREHGVKRLELFGSAATERFDPDSSDLDFLVEFLPLPVGSLFDSYIGLLEDLAELLGRDVHLVTERSIRSRYFLRAVDQTRAVVYAA